MRETTMARIAVASLAVLLCVAVAAEANPVVWFGEQQFPPTEYNFVGGPGQTVDVSLYVANDPYTDDASYTSLGGFPGLNLYVQLGDGGQATDGSDYGPQFVSGPPHPGLDDGFSSGYVINGGDPIDGTVFSSNYFPAGDGGESTDQLLLISINAASGVVPIPDLPAPGVLLATLHITFPPGTQYGNYPISIDGSASSGLPPLDFVAPIDNVVLVNAKFAAIPEPGSWALGLLGLIGFIGLVVVRRQRAARSAAA